MLSGRSRRDGEAGERAERSRPHHLRVRSGDGAGTVNLTITLDAARAQRGLRLIVAPVEEERTLAAKPAKVVVSVWRESETIVRGTIRHPSSGTVAHFQGSNALLRIVEALRMRLDATP